jgi:hypothetical protein
MRYSGTFANFGLAASTAEACSRATPDISITYRNQSSLGNGAESRVL